MRHSIKIEVRLSSEKHDRNDLPFLTDTTGDVCAHSQSVVSTCTPSVGVYRSLRVAHGRIMYSASKENVNQI